MKRNALKGCSLSLLIAAVVSLLASCASSRRTEALPPKSARAAPSEPAGFAPRSFDPSFALPLASSLDLTAEKEDLLQRSEELVLRNFKGGKSPARLGDLVLACASPDLSPAQVKDRLSGWDLDAQTQDALVELCSRSKLYSEQWKPKRSGDNDGIWEGATLDRSRWSDWDGSKDIFQGAVLLLDDMLAIKTAEHDFRVYPKHVGAKYDFIGAVPGSLERGFLAPDQPFAAVRFRFKADLPFPFGGYRCLAQLFHRLDAEGRVVTDLWSTSSDFLWLASQDVYLPIQTEAGEFVGYLLVRRHGFDLAGVPDGKKERKSALRESLGNLARDVNPTGQAHSFAPDDVAQALATFPVQGWAPKED